MHIEILIGLPGSGKSTYAKKRAIEGYMVVDVDSIALMCHGGEYKFQEYLKPLYFKIFDKAVDVLIDSGYNVVIDSTCLTKEVRAYWINKYGKKHTITAVCWEPNPITNIINRVNDSRGYPSERWIDVISRMFECYERPSKKEGFKKLEFKKVKCYLHFDKK